MNIYHLSSRERLESKRTSKKEGRKGERREGRKGEGRKKGREGRRDVRIHGNVDYLNT